VELLSRLYANAIRTKLEKIMPALRVFLKKADFHLSGGINSPAPFSAAFT